MKFKLLKKFTFKWHIKLLALALAFILWIYVDNLKETERFISIPLEMKNIPDGFMVSNGIPLTVKVIIKGKESKLSLFDENNVYAFVDLENKTKNEQKAIVKIDQDSVPQGISIKEINPRIIEINIERIVKKLVSVIPVITAEPPYGYNFEDVQMDPEQVFVSGPDSILKSLDAIYTKDINIQSLTETTVMEVGLNIENSQISLEDNNSVSVKIIIKEQFVVRRFKKDEVGILNLDEAFHVHFEEVLISVLLKLPKRMEKDFTARYINLFVDCTSITGPGDYNLPIIFESEKNDVTLINIEPQSINAAVSLVSET
jgi:YbbR domain-containing protein